MKHCFLISPPPTRGTWGARVLFRSGSNTFPILVGDFMRAYALVGVSDLRITIDDSITSPGQVIFYVRRWVLGDVINDDAVKAVKCATS